jgi:hypothetical protein
MPVHAEHCRETAAGRQPLTWLELPALDGLTQALRDPQVARTVVSRDRKVELQHCLRTLALPWQRRSGPIRI